MEDSLFIDFIYSYFSVLFGSKNKNKNKAKQNKKNRREKKEQDL